MIIFMEKCGKNFKKVQAKVQECGKLKMKRWLLLRKGTKVVKAATLRAIYYEISVIINTNFKLVPIAIKEKPHFFCATRDRRFIYIKQKSPINIHTLFIYNQKNKQNILCI